MISTYNHLVRNVFICVTLCTCLPLSNVTAKAAKFVSNAKVIAADEYSYRGQDVDLYVQDRPAVLVVVPQKTAADVRAQIEQEIALLNPYFPAESSDDFPFKKLDKGVIELNQYIHRYVVEVDEQSEPGIIITDGYSDTSPIFAPYTGQKSFVNELQAYFEVKSQKKFKRYYNKRITSYTTGDEAALKKRLKVMLKVLSKDHTPTLTEAQTSSVNKAILTRIDAIYGLNLAHADFDKPFRELEARIETGSATGNNTIAYRNAKQQRIFSNAKFHGGEYDVFRTNYYHSNGLLKRSKEKYLRLKNGRQKHTTDHLFWESDYVVLVYRIQDRGYERDLDHTSVQRFTFDKEYRLIKVEMPKFDAKINHVSDGNFYFETRYDDDGNYVEDMVQDGKVLSSSQFVVKNGKIAYVESKGDGYVRKNVFEGNVQKLIDGDGTELMRTERFFDKEGYLVKEETQGSLMGEQTILFSYKK